MSKAGESPQIRAEHLTEEDKGLAGRRPWWAFGPYHVAALAGVSRRTIRRAIEEGVPLWFPVHAVAYAVAKRGRPDIADAVLELLGEAPMYQRKRNRKNARKRAVDFSDPAP